MAPQAETTARPSATTPATSAQRPNADDKSNDPSTPPDASEPPAKRPRWLYARGKGWATFAPEDDDALEKRWQELGGKEWAATIEDDDGNSDEVQSDTQNEEKQQQQQKQQRQQQEDQQEQQKSGGRRRRPPMPAAPPSGVDAVRSALSSFTELPDKAKRTVKETADQAAGASSKPSGSATPLKKVAKGIKLGTDMGGDDAKKDDKKSKKDEKVMVNEILDPDQPESERKTKVAVMEDKLFDVDLERMVLYPVFWKGVLLRVVRSEWFYSSSTDGSYAPISCMEPLSADLDKAYSEAKPWARDAAVSDIRQAEGGSKGKGNSKDDDRDEAMNKEQLYPLPSMEDEGRIVFESAEVGRIFSEDWRGRFLSVMGGSKVVRGFDKAEAIAKEKSSGSYLPFSLPWAADNEDDPEDDEAKDGDPSKSRKQLRQEKGSTFGARSASRREGAAQTGGKPAAGGGADESNPSPADGDDTDERRSFASKLWPSSDSLTRPAVALLRMIGYSHDDATEEGKRQVKQKATEDEVDRQRNSNTSQGEGGGEKVDASGGDEMPEIKEDLKDEPPELVLAVHGIGQQLTEDFDALDFVYDVERLRNVSNTQAADPAVRRMARGRRAQYIPICWRRALTFDEKPEGNDNHYTLDDVTNSAAIPIVRNVISKVVLDVPFYLSHHRQKMIDSVTAELNRTYRLFCRRNPDFERKGGRVSVIGHSLGSALAADILSAQPTKVPLLYEVENDNRETLRDNKHLHFNVKNLFFIGSPVGFFFYLDGGQLIARRGTARNPDGAETTDEDASLDQQGKYGCLAAETVYNIYNPTDPVAFQLGPTADREFASMVKPIPIADAAGALLQALAMPRLSVSKIFEKYGNHPFKAVGKIVKQAARYEESDDVNDDEEDYEVTADGANSFAREERKMAKERELGRKIIESSHFLKRVRKMKKLDDEARKQEEADEVRTSKESRDDDGDDAGDAEGATGASTPIVDEPAPMSTERGTLQKRMQPRRTLDDARSRNLSTSSSPAADRDEEEDEAGQTTQHVDLDSLERGERRFRALNPHGCIDFMLSSNIAFSEYLDMIGAHVSYWTHPDFATFVLTQLFADWNRKDVVTVVPDLELPGDKREGEEDGDEEGEEGGDDESAESEEGDDSEEDEQEEEE